MAKKEKKNFDISIIDELNEIKAILAFLSDSTVSILSTSNEKLPLTKTPHGMSLVFSSIIERLDNLKETINLECKTRN